MRAAFITGAASGIGAATARRFARAGWLVGLWDIDEKGAVRLAAEIGSDKSVAGALDVRDPEAWAKAAERFGAAAGGRMDVLVNNAGVLAVGPFEDLPSERVRALVEVNLMGPIHGIRASLPLLRATKGARIVNLASLTALRAIEGAAVYGATKHAVRGLSHALRAELKPAGVAVTVVYPTFVETPMMAPGAGGVDAALRERLAIGGFKFYPPETIAEAIWKAVERGWDEVGGSNQGRFIRFLAASCPPLLGLLWRIRAAKVARRLPPEDAAGDDG